MFLHISPTIWLEGPWEKELDVFFFFPGLFCSVLPFIHSIQCLAGYKCFNFTCQTPPNWAISLVKERSKKSMEKFALVAIVRRRQWGWMVAQLVKYTSYQVQGPPFQSLGVPTYCRALGMNFTSDLAVIQKAQVHYFCPSLSLCRHN